jgi:CRISPR/Cas system CSM-associated protein Csm3 (group 7 of RAMP superfamily)
MNASLSRYRKTTHEERLFSTEIAWHYALNAKVLGFFTSEIDAKKAAALLWFAAKAGFAIGAARSRGLGWLELAEFQAQTDDSLLSYNEMTDTITNLTLQKEVDK